jgi:aminoglycoside 6'-N-acetyltransferase I
VRNVEYSIREITAADRKIWSEMRAALWPEETAEQHARGLDVLLRDGLYWGFVAEDGDARGFAEVSIRRYANGCDTQPVPFLEGIWVDPKFRRHGIGAQLLAHVEAFMVALGFHELGSDALINNMQSHAAHRAWGFVETERVIYFRKVLRKK